MIRVRRFVAWTVLLGAAAAALDLAGRALPSPPLASPERWPGWLAGHDPVVVAFALVRLLALGFAWYALLVTVAHAGARLLAAAHLAAALDRLTFPPLRRVLAATMSVGIGTASVSPVAAAAARPAAASVAFQPSTTTTTTEPPVDSLTMRELPPLDGSPSSDAPGEPGAVGAPGTWTVRPGECFWSIAEDVLAAGLGRRATPAEVVPYWRRLVDANRTVLADRDNPDLVFPGQVFTVPD